MKIGFRIDSEKHATNILGWLGVWMALVLYAYLSGMGGAQELAFGYVGASGAISHFLVRAGLSSGQGTVPWMPDPFIITLSAALVVVIGMIKDPEDGHHLALAMTSHMGQILEKFAKTRAGESEE